MFLVVDTRKSCTNARDLVQLLGYDAVVTLDANGYVGGMCLLYDKDILSASGSYTSQFVIKATVKFNRHSRF